MLSIFELKSKIVSNYHRIRLSTDEEHDKYISEIKAKIEPWFNLCFLNISRIYIGGTEGKNIQCQRFYPDHDEESENIYEYTCDYAGKITITPECILPHLITIFAFRMIGDRYHIEIQFNNKHKDLMLYYYYYTEVIMPILNAAGYTLVTTDNGCTISLGGIDK